jgi:dCMP deaminase
MDTTTTSATYGRICRHQWALKLALVTAQRSTCLRRRVGCVLLDVNGFVLSTGYNGVASGVDHCNEPRYSTAADGSMQLDYPYRCPGASSASGTNLDGCHAIHAEQNALIQVRDHTKIDACYVTHSPCIHCVKMLMNTWCSSIYFVHEYPHQEAKDLWLSSWEQRMVSFGQSCDYRKSRLLDRWVQMPHVSLQT